MPGVLRVQILFRSYIIQSHANFGEYTVNVRSRTRVPVKLSV